MNSEGGMRNAENEHQNFRFVYFLIPHSKFRITMYLKPIYSLEQVAAELPHKN